jgi:hypothetical protein
MRFDRETGDDFERVNGAVSFVLHRELSEQLIRRMAPHLPWAVCVHSLESPSARSRQTPSPARRSEPYAVDTCVRRRPRRNVHAGRHQCTLQARCG